MNIECRQITVHGLPVQIVRKDIKNLHLGVYPPHGRIRVAAPLRVQDEAVRLAVVSKLGWIKRQRTRFQSQDRQSVREYLGRESHYYLGQRYLLNVIEHDGPSRVGVRNKKILDVYAPKGAGRAKKQQVLMAWYRKELKALIAPMIAKWGTILDVQVADWRIKKMKTKWGSCNRKAHRIWLNLELAKKPVQCVEYIVVHEMAHLLERLHNDRFTSLMDKFLPHWRLHRDELNRALLGHETWSY